MIPPSAPYTPEMTFAALNEKSKTEDSFVLKLGRKRGLTGLSEHVATLRDAVLNHIVNPETWLHALGGGGEYSIQCYHNAEPSVRVGGMLFATIRGASKEIDPNAVKHASWQGPATLLFPTLDPQPLIPWGGMVQQPGQPSTQFQQGNTLPGQQPFVPPPGPAGESYEMRQYRESVERRERELTEKQARIEREAIEQREELKRREAELKMTRDVDAKLAAMAKENQRPPEKGVMDWMPALLAGLAPIAAAFMNSSKEARETQAKMSADQMNMLTQILIKQGETKGTSPEMQMMLELIRSSQSGSAEMMSRIVEAFGAVSKTSVAMVEAIADLQLGEQPENPILQAIREGVKAMGALSTGATTGAQKIVRQQTQTMPALPQGQQQRPQPPRPAPTPQPNMPPANERPTQQQPAGFNGVEDALEDTVDKLERLIREKQPPTEVAQFFVDAIKKNDKSLIAALEKVDGDPNKLIGERLSGWLLEDPDHIEYIKELGSEVDRIGAEQGIWEPDDSGEEESAPAPSAPSA